MYEEGVSQYHSAKQQAIKRVIYKGAKKSNRIQNKDLPSNDEISKAVYELACLYEGDSLGSRLFEMRVVALNILDTLSAFSPRLIGSVSTGRIKMNSDIDIHLFCDHIEEIEQTLVQLRWPFETDQITINQNGVFKEYTHIYLQDEFPVELSVYPVNDIRVRTRSSTDGKPIVRYSYQKLLALIEEEHSQAWADYLGF